VYCTGYNGVPNDSMLPNMTFPCSYYDESFALLPSPLQSNSLFISTRITLTEQRLPSNCTIFQPNCSYYMVSQNTTYVADIEKFTILIDHNMYVPSPRVQQTGTELKGTFKDHSDQPVKLSQPDQVGEIGKFDILQLGTLLKAAGIDSLDTVGQRNNMTKRYEGIVLLLFINYTNVFTYNLNNLQYFVHADVVKNSYFKVEQPVYTKSISDRLIWNRHGVQVIVIQTGQVAAFDFQVALLTFVSGLGLVTVSTVFVDLLATKILPKKKIYKKYKYDNTKDFDDTDITEYGAIRKKVENRVSL